MGHTEQPVRGACRNCGARLEGEYCQHCGQRALDLDRPLRELLREALDGFHFFDTRIIRTLVTLVARPGLLTAEYLAGHRTRYISPLKLYLAISFLLFLALALTESAAINLHFKDAEGNRISEYEDFVRMARAQQTDGAGDGVEPGERDSSSGSLLPATDTGSSAAGASPAQDEAERTALVAYTAFEQLKTDLPSRLAQTMFVLVPLFALLLKLVFGWQRAFYVRHLVCALHLHAFVFLALLVGFSLDVAVKGLSGLFTTVAFLVIASYVYLALRRIYGLSGRRTVSRIGLLGLLYLPLVGVGALVAVFLSLALWLGQVGDLGPSGG